MGDINQFQTLTRRLLKYRHFSRRIDGAAGCACCTRRKRRCWKRWDSWSRILSIFFHGPSNQGKLEDQPRFFLGKFDVSKLFADSWLYIYICIYVYMYIHTITCHELYYIKKNQTDRWGCVKTLTRIHLYVHIEGIYLHIYIYVDI